MGLDLSGRGVDGLFEPRFMIVEGVRGDAAQAPALTVFDKDVGAYLPGVIAWAVETDQEGAVVVLKFRAPFEAHKLAIPPGI